MDRRDFLVSCAQCAAASLAWQAPMLCLPREALAENVPQRGFIREHPSPYYEKLSNGSTKCLLCPRGCELGEGGTGWCGVRRADQGKIVSRVYGNPCAVNVDPIEKKPFFHVLPGTTSFSVATAGCNFDCKFCQNWEISQADPEETLNYDLPPELAASLAKKYGCASIASTYVEPTIFLEYMLDMGREARAGGMLNVMHSNGFVNQKPLDDLCGHLDAACIDLKGFTEEYYSEVTEGELAPVLASLKRLRANGKHVELVNLILPGKNDSMREIEEMCEWIHDELGPDTPLHLTRFYPRYKYNSLPPTPVRTLERARDTAMGAGLNFVYVGNVPGHLGESTWCPECGAKVIRRRGFVSEVVGLEHGKCTSCGREIPGIWDLPAK